MPISWPVETTVHNGVVVVRDDRLPGGSKRRFLSPLLGQLPEDEFVFGGPAEGYAQVALGWSAIDTGKRATFFIAERQTEHPLTIEGRKLGVNYMTCRPGYLTVIQKRAKDYAADAGARFFPLGFAAPDVESSAVATISAAVVGLEAPPQVFVTAGSGFLSRVLQQVWPEAEHHAVRIGMPPNVGDATLHNASEAFKDKAVAPPPFPSCIHYDAKAWRFVEELARPGALFWNVGA